MAFYVGMSYGCPYQSLYHTAVFALCEGNQPWATGVPSWSLKALVPHTNCASEIIWLIKQS